jgi:hypothetical protein
MTFRRNKRRAGENQRVRRKAEAFSKFDLMVPQRGRTAGDALMLMTFCLAPTVYNKYVTEATKNKDLQHHFPMSIPSAMHGALSCNPGLVMLLADVSDHPSLTGRFETVQGELRACRLLGRCPDHK